MSGTVLITFKRTSSASHSASRRPAIDGTAAALLRRPLATTLFAGAFFFVCFRGALVVLIGDKSIFAGFLRADFLVTGGGVFSRRR
jgi:hypothetical protein